MIILGSSSPRRKEILSYFKIPFNVLTPDFDELSVSFDGDPEEYVKKISQGKANAIFSAQTGLPILTADTIVTKDQQIYLKPADEEQAIQMLQKLCGKTHEVLTAVTLKDERKTQTTVTKTLVTFHDFPLEMIQKYVKSVPVLDKSGSYAIQGIGSLIVKKIEGCFYNVMGLPLNATAKLLEEFGFNLWHHLNS